MKKSIMLYVLVIGLLCSGASALAAKSSRSQAARKEHVFMFKGASSISKTRSATPLPQAAKLPEANSKLHIPALQSQTEPLRLAMLFIIAMCILVAVIVILAISLFGVGSKNPQSERSESASATRQEKTSAKGSTAPAPVLQPPVLNDPMGASCLYEPSTPKAGGYVPSYSVKSQKILYAFPSSKSKRMTWQDLLPLPVISQSPNSTTPFAMAALAV